MFQKANRGVPSGDYVLKNDWMRRLFKKSGLLLRLCYSIHCSKRKNHCCYRSEKSWVNVRTLRRSTCKWKSPLFPENSEETLQSQELQGDATNNSRLSHFHRLFKSKAATAGEDEDAAQAGVNNASKGGIIYGDYLQVENCIYILDQSFSTKSKRLVKFGSVKFHFSSYLSLKKSSVARFCRVK